MNTELVQAVFKGLFGVLLIMSVGFLAYAGRISDQLSGAVYGVAAAYAFHIVPDKLNGWRNGTVKDTR